MEEVSQALDMCCGLIRYRVLEGVDQEAASGAISANVGSLGLEFTKLSQLTGDPKFYDASM